MSFKRLCKLKLMGSFFDRERGGVLMRQRRGCPFASFRVVNCEFFQHLGHFSRLPCIESFLGLLKFCHTVLVVQIDQA